LIEKDTDPDPDRQVLDADPTGSGSTTLGYTTVYYTETSIKMQRWLKKYEVLEVHFITYFRALHMMYCIYSSVCLAEETRAGVLILHKRQEAPVTGGPLTIVCGCMRWQDLVEISFTGDRRLVASKGSLTCLPG
jgi:hypothetical protein